MRIVRSSVNGAFIIDPRGKEKGRGTYVCLDVDCVNKAMEPQRISRAFKAVQNSVDRIGLETIDKLRQDLLELIEVERH